MSCCCIKPTSAYLKPEPRHAAEPSFLNLADTSFTATIAEPSATSQQTGAERRKAALRAEMRGNRKQGALAGVARLAGIREKQVTESRNATAPPAPPAPRGLVWGEAPAVELGSHAISLCQSPSSISAFASSSSVLFPQGLLKPHENIARTFGKGPTAHCLLDKFLRRGSRSVTPAKVATGHSHSMPASGERSWLR